MKYRIEYAHRSPDTVANLGTAITFVLCAMVSLRGYKNTSVNSLEINGRRFCFCTAADRDASTDGAGAFAVISPICE